MKSRESLFDLADWLTSPPSGGRVQMWTVGAFVAAAFSIYGLVCCLTQHARIPNLPLRGFPPLSRQLIVDINEPLAVPVGLVFIFVGLFIHSQWFWGNHQRLFPYHELGKLLAAIGLVASLLRLVYVMIMDT